MKIDEKKRRALQAASDMLGVCVDVICSRADVGVLTSLRRQTDAGKTCLLWQPTRVRTEA